MTFIAKFFLLVLVLGMAEVYLLVKVAATLGFFSAAGLCVLTGVIGGALVRQQGFQTLVSIQESLGQGLSEQTNGPTVEIVGGVVLLIVGVLLLTPGFITDALGFLMLVPRLRLSTARVLVAHFRRRSRPMPFGVGFFSGNSSYQQHATPPDSSNGTYSKSTQRVVARIIDADAVETDS